MENFIICAMDIIAKSLFFIYSIIIHWARGIFKTRSDIYDTAILAKGIKSYFRK